MKSRIVEIMLIISISLFCETHIPEGNVHGRWSIDGSPYFINGDITIPNAETLIIDPGVSILFQGEYKLYVQGRLLAEGTESDSINFDISNSVPPGRGWFGIYFYHTSASNDSSKISYNILKNAINTLYANACYDEASAIRFDDFSKARVSHCRFSQNKTYAGGAIKCYLSSSPTVEYCSFNDNSAICIDSAYPLGGAIFIKGTSSPIIRNNIFVRNSGYYGGAICLLSDNGGVFENNIFYDNFAGYGGAILTSSGSNLPAVFKGNIVCNNRSLYYGGGIYIGSFYDSPSAIIENAYLSNNTIVNNEATWGGGIAICGDKANLINNIVWNNSGDYGTQIYLKNSSTPTSPDFYNCLINGGVEEFFMQNGNAFEGDYVNCLNLDPQFSNFELNDFHLKDSSPLIGAGINFMDFNNINFDFTGIDIDGTSRPYPLLTDCDIGAYENLLAEPVDINENILFDSELYSYNYPEPFNPSTVICFDGSSFSEYQLRVYNSLGQMIYSKDHLSSMKKNEKISFNGKNLSSGIYVYIIVGKENNSKLITGKMTLLK
ncbi:MAG: T9SS type A sorting domain-containing protein [Candidatus Delongbacteria bacterium]|nr:T9SS type A sorting domain-containing protein [Candidatus Delongbacteria bacterium]MBN2833562.1 T9SS type A sorting domain-containing protein [Candidatus Delongbacteria bacterium]